MREGIGRVYQRVPAGRSECLRLMLIFWGATVTENSLEPEMSKAEGRAAMRTELLRFNGAVRRDPAIDAWMKEHEGELGAVARQWFEVMRGCGDEVRELFHDGGAVECLGDAPFGYVNVFSSHVNVGF